MGRARRRGVRFVNELERPIGTYLYGRRMYETMAGWETDEIIGDRQPVMVDFAEIWRAADKVVFSRTLETVSSARTRIEATFDPEMIQKMKSSAKSDLTVGWCRVGSACVSGRVDRRVSSPSQSDIGGRWEAGSAERGPDTT